MKWFNNLKVSLKLVISFLVVAMIACTIGIVGIVNIKSVDNSDTILYDDITVPLGQLSHISELYQRQRVIIRDIILLPNVEDKNSEVENLKGKDSQIEQLATEYYGIIKNNPTEKQLYDVYKNAVDKYKPLREEVLKLALAQKTVEAYGLLQGKETDEAAMAVQDAITKMRDSKIEEGKTQKNDNNETTKLSIIILVAFIAGGVALAVALGLFISRTISKPVKKLAVAANKIAEGDLDITIDIDTGDEIGELAKSMGVMAGNIKDVNPAVAELTNACIEGRLFTRGDESKFKGAYKEIIAGFNKTLDTLLGHFDAMPAPVMIVDKDFNVLYMNKKGAEVIGMAQSQIIGTKCYDCFKTSDCRTSKCACSIAINQGINATSETDAHPNGLNLDITYSAFPLKDMNKQIIGAMELVVDQTDIKNAARLAKKQAEYQDKEVSKLLIDIENLSQGKLQANSSVEPTDEDTKAIGLIFNRIYKSYEESVKTISSYIKEISKVLTEMSKGNMDMAISGDYKGEFVEIKSTLNLIIESFNKVLSDINSASEQVASGARQVSSSSQSLSQGSTEQASSIEEITSAITEVAAQTKQNALNANKANELAVVAKENAVQGNTQMKEMLKAMEEINDSSASISKIIKVIDEIAFQTNILALNAAVEAARAGQHGKGFAVVAEEVRNLAARSANAAKETTTMIEGSIKKVEVGTKIANDTADALGKIVEDVTKAAVLVGDIADASNEQATGIAQVNQAITQVAGVVQTNSATAQEGAAASEELSGQAEVLKESVEKFKLKKNLQTVGNFDGLKPDVVKAIENMIEKKTLQKSFDEVAPADEDIKISLENRYFGKY